MIHHDKKEEKKPAIQYIELKTGEKLIKGDEYNSTVGIWRQVPDFMLGEFVPDSEYTKWRRHVKEESKPKKNWFSFFS